MTFSVSLQCGSTWTPELYAGGTVSTNNMLSESLSRVIFRCLLSDVKVNSASCMERQYSQAAAFYYRPSARGHEARQGKWPGPHDTPTRWF